MPTRKNKRKLNELIESARNAKRQKSEKKICNGIDVDTLNEWKISLNNVHGRSRTPNEVALLIQELIHWQLEGNSLDSAIKIIKNIHGGGYETYKIMWDNWVNNDKSLNIKGTIPRGRPHTSINYISNLTEEDEFEIAQFIYKYTIANPTGFSCPDFCRFLNDDRHYDFNTQQCMQILNYYNCKFDDQPKYYGVITDERVDDFKRFLYSYSHALQLEEKDEAVIVYSDETWANVDTCMKKSFRHDCGNNYECISEGLCSKLIEISGEDWAKAKVSKRDGGRRAAICWAHTKDGILYGKDELGQDAIRLNKQQQLDFSNNIPTSELIFECKKQGDYHLQFNAELYEEYLITRLIPAFKNKYGNDKKLILVIDQAPYHTRRCGFPSTNDNKNTIISYYYKYNIESITINRKNGGVKTFNRTEFNRRSPNGPSKDELLLYLFYKLKLEKPQELETLCSQIISRAGGLVLYTVPNNPDDQPHELFNAHIKHYVRKNAKNGRTMNELISDIQNGAYGGVTMCNAIHKGFDSATAIGCQKTCHNNMNKEINELLKIDNKDIHNLYSENSKYNIFQKFIKIPWSVKTLKRFKTEFQIILN